jgi:hypothetical protein
VDDDVSDGLAVAGRLQLGFGRKSERWSTAAVIEARFAGRVRSEAGAK